MVICVCVWFRKCSDIKNWRYGDYVEGVGIVGCRKLACAANVTVNEFSCLPMYVSLTEYLCVLGVTKYGILIVITRYKGRGEVTCVHTVKHAWVEAQCHSFLIMELDGGRWSTSCSSHFTPSAKEHPLHSVVGLMDSRANLDVLEWRKISYLCQDSNPRLSCSSVVATLSVRPELCSNWTYILESNHIY